MRLNSAVRTPFLLLSLFALFVFAPNAFAQQLNKTLTEKAFSFDYPVDWRLVDKSSTGVQQYNLMPPSGNVLIMLISYDAIVPGYDDFNRVRTSTAQKLADRLFLQLDKSGNAKQADSCTVIENISLPGKKITGFYEAEPSTAEIYYFALNQKFFNFIYLRDDKESAQSDAAWNTLLNSFSFKKLNEKKPDFMIDLGSDVVLNGRAKKLAVPLYPRDPVIMRVPDVKVRITIDETGKVIAAKALIPGSSYAPYAENAAMDSKFEPSLICGKPSRISGIIVYRGYDRR